MSPVKHGGNWHELVFATLIVLIVLGIVVDAAVATDAAYYLTPHQISFPIPLQLVGIVVDLNRVIWLVMLFAIIAIIIGALRYFLKDQ